ncbi:hypothetical protein GCM10009555_027770 [Acrocarpospora macrocephala]|uniref:Uncharacterized protein n=1 Tax=Acrocarpospora macrocephala TaxID=150177 RepID=A0A5M3X367_9ACTN|nr:hypothetical protein [Acrocarpospora macrocephala]GES15564.1 hypothetical protein Amac_091610 [Acrocarpospora macrocephala]
MAEFMGMDPAGVQDLIRRLETGKSVLAGVRPGLESAIAEAGPDWAGVGGATAMHRTWAFFHDSQADLRWRLEVLQQVLPDRPFGPTKVDMPFANQAEAAAAGKRAGAELAGALAVHQREDTLHSWAKVEAALAAAGGKARDPAYAAAFLGALDGADTIHTIFNTWMDIHAAGQRGLPPEIWETAEESLGALAAAFAAAEGTGNLPAGWREDILRADPATLSAMVGLARTSTAFLNEVGRRQFSSPGTGSAPLLMGPDWNSVLVARAFTANPAALQRLLAEHKEIAGRLLRPQLVNGAGTTEFSRLLAAALDRALALDTGSAALREQALINLIKGVGYQGTEEVSGHFATFEDSPLSPVLAKRLIPYLGELARGQASVDPDNLVKPPTGRWRDLDVDTAARFVGALMQNPDTTDTLRAAFRAYAQDLNIGQAHPYSPDPAERATFTRLSAEASGLANLLLGGSAYAEFNDDEFIDAVADAALLPVNYGIAKASVNATPLTSATVDHESSGYKDGMVEIIKNRLDVKTPETARVMTDDLVDAQMAILINSLEANKQEPLTAADASQVKSAFRGRLFSALTKALEVRGG